MNLSNRQLTTAGMRRTDAQEWQPPASSLREFSKVIKANTMTFVLDLPLSFVVSLLAEWLSIFALPHVDTSVCNTAERGRLLSLLCHPHMIAKPYKGVLFSGYLSWVCSRKVKLGEMLISKYLGAHLPAIQSSVDRSKLSTLEISGVHYPRSSELGAVNWLASDILVIIINSSTALTSLTISGPLDDITDESLRLVDDSIWNGLLLLALRNLHCVSKSILPYLSAKCHNLHEIDICLSGSAAVTEADVIAFLGTNGSLASVKILLEDMPKSSLCNFIVLHCQNILTLDLYQFDILKPAVVRPSYMSYIRLIAQCPNLRDARVGGGSGSVSLKTVDDLNKATLRCVTICGDSYNIRHMRDEAAKTVIINEEINSLLAAFSLPIANVQSLMLSSYYHIRNDTLYAVAQCFTELQVLHLVATAQPQPQPYFSMHMPTTTNHVYNDFSYGLRAVLNSCLKLTRLTIEFNSIVLTVLVTQICLH
jgi:hypothetical protein